MTETITEPLVLIDQMIAENLHAVTPLSTTPCPPRFLRLLSAEGEAYAITRRNPAQTTDMVEYWHQEGAKVLTPPSFLLPKDNADVRVIFHDKPSALDTRGWKLHVGYDSMLLGDYYSGRNHPERKRQGAPLSPKQLESFLTLLRNSQILDFSRTSDTKKWYTGLARTLEARQKAQDRYTNAHPQDQIHI